MSQIIQAKTILIHDINTTNTANIMVSQLWNHINGYDIFSTNMDHNDYEFTINIRNYLYSDDNGFNPNHDFVILLCSMNSIINDETYFRRQVITWYNKYWEINKECMVIFVCDNTGLNRSQNDLENNEIEELCGQYGFKYYEINCDNKEYIYINIRNYILKQNYKKHYPMSWELGNTQNHWNNFWNKLYDILTILISFADLGTDLWVLYQYYNKGRMTFFIIGLIIIIMTHIVYCVAFIVKFSSVVWSFSDKIIRFLILLPFSWLLGIAFYLSTNEESWFVKVFLEKWFPFYVEIENDNDESKSISSKWFWENMEKHIGFVLESVCESIPMVILQMIAMVLYKEANSVVIISILLSIISVSIKTLIFSRSIDNGIFIWNWLCASAVNIM